MVMQAQAAPPKVAESVDLEHYAGDWYEIAKYPVYFQRNCGATKATYSLNASKGLKVLNVCQHKSNPKRLIRALGKARVVDPRTNAKLKVSFSPIFKKLTEGDYWILYVSPDYQVAAVGTPDRDNLWFLSRTQSVSQETYSELLKIAEDEGFNPKKLIKTPGWNQ